MKKLLLFFISFMFMPVAFANDGVSCSQMQDVIGSRPVNISVIKMCKDSPYKLKLTFGEGKITNLRRVEYFSQNENSVAALNASYFKQDTGTPVGLCIFEGKLFSGPLFNRCVFGIDKNQRYFIENVSLQGNLRYSRENIRISSINQPIVCSDGAYLYNYQWGMHTPPKEACYHFAVINNRITEVSSSSIPVPEDGYAVVVPKACVKDAPKVSSLVRYSYGLSPRKFCKVDYAFAAGPWLVKNGQKYIDYEAQKFSKFFAIAKTARSAIGIDEQGNVFLVAVDGKQKGVSEGVSLYEMADIMLKLGAVDAMNLDGGSSTQMVYQGRLINIPTNKYGAAVTNAVVIVKEEEE